MDHIAVHLFAICKCRLVTIFTNLYYCIIIVRVLASVLGVWGQWSYHEVFAAHCI